MPENYSRSSSSYTATIGLRGKASMSYSIGVYRLERDVVQQLNNASDVCDMNLLTSFYSGNLMALTRGIDSPFDNIRGAKVNAWLGCY